MFSSLPWFIKKKIIEYSVSYYKKLCILNKEWFHYGAGRFMTASSQLLRKKEHLSSWYNLAENLRLREYSCVDLNFLKDYRFIKSVFFEFNSELELDFDKHKEVICALQLSEIYFELGRKNISDGILSLVMNNAKQLQVLSLKSQYYKMDFDELLRVDFPKIIYFKFDSEKSSLDFKKFHQRLSQVEQIIKTHDIAFGNSSTKKMVFRHLEHLDVCFDQGNNFIGPDSFNPFFQFTFPCLVYLALSANFKYNDLGKLRHNIPNVRELHLNIRFQKENEVVFPNNSLEHLRNFYISCENEEKAKIISIVINLDFLPELKYINLIGNLKLSESKIVSPLTDLIYKNFTIFPHKKIGQQMQNITKLFVSCKLLTNQIETIFLLCDRLENLYISDISSIINSNHLPQGKFKTNLLDLTGGYFLTDRIIAWIYQQQPLSSFRITYYSEEELC